MDTKNNTKEFYDSTAEQYDFRQNNPSAKWLRQHEEELIKKYAKGKVLDIGCGTGYHLQFLSKLGFNKEDITGLDISSCMIDEARKKVNCSFVLGNAEETQFPINSFDSVLCMHSTLNLTNVERVLTETRAALKENGYFIVSVSSVWDKEYRSFIQRLGESNITRKTLHLHKYHMDFRLFTERTMKELFKKHGFACVYFKGLFVLQRPYWGRFQPFSIAETIKLRFGDSINIFDRAGSVYLGVFKKYSD